MIFSSQRIVRLAVVNIIEFLLSVVCMGIQTTSDLQAQKLYALNRDSIPRTYGGLLVLGPISRS